MIIEKFNIFRKKKKEQYCLILNSKNTYSVLQYIVRKTFNFIDIEVINSNNCNEINHIEYFDSIEEANRRLGFIINKYTDSEWINRNNWNIVNVDDLYIFLSASKFNL